MKTNWNIDEIQSELYQIVKTQMKLDDSFTPASELVAMGLDSLSMVRILAVIEDKFGVWLEGDALTPEHLKDVESMAQCIFTLISPTANNSL